MAVRKPVFIGSYSTSVKKQRHCHSPDLRSLHLLPRLIAIHGASLPLTLTSCSCESVEG